MQKELLFQCGKGETQRDNLVMADNKDRLQIASKGNGSYFKQKIILTRL